MLGDVEVAEIDFRARGRGSEFERVLKCVERAGKVLLRNADDAEEVETFDAFRIFGEFSLNLLASFIEAALLEQGLHFLKTGIDLLGHRR